MFRKVKICMSILVTLIMVANLVGNASISVKAVEKEEQIIGEIIKDNTYFRKDASKESAVLYTFSTGELVSIVGSKESKAGNIFFEGIMYDESGNEMIGYIYEGNITNHEHCFDYEDEQVSFCKCGYCEVKLTKNEMENMGFTDAVQNGWLLGEEAALAAVNTSVWGSTAITGLNAAFPYVAGVVFLVAIAGTVYLVITNEKVTEVEETIKFDKNNYDKLKEFTGYYSCSTKPGGCFLYINPKEKTLEEAVEYLNRLIKVGEIANGRGLLDKNTLNSKSLNAGIYTFGYDNAVKLAEAYEVQSINGFELFYGDGNGEVFDNHFPNIDSDHCFPHFHVGYNKLIENDIMKKETKPRVHIIFGIPFNSSDNRYQDYINEFNVPLNKFL